MSITGTAHIAADPEALADMAAEFLLARIMASSGIFRLVLTGGVTPRLLYRKLAIASYASQIPWSRVELFWGDERCVPWDHPDSNFRMARETLLSSSLVAPRGIYAIPTDATPEEGARRYETTLKEYYGASTINPERPLFDCVLLGLGPDGHIASLLPNQPVLDEKNQWVAAVPKGRDEPRITLTYPALQSSRVTAFLVTGSQKAEAVERVRAGDTNLPGGRLKPEGETVWFLDSAAAAPRS
jgi:6-phosphogluconolactonase